MKVVRAQREHFTDLWQLTRELHAEAVGRYPFADLGMDANGQMMALHRVLGWCLDTSMVVLMVYDEEVPVGYMHLQFFPFVGSENAPIASSAGFYIRPEYRKSRAIILLYRTARETLRSKGVAYVQACVLTTNTDTAKLYKDHGYDAVATIFQRDIREVHPDGRKLPGQEVRQGSGGSNEDRTDRPAGLPQ